MITLSSLPKNPTAQRSTGENDDMLTSNWIKLKLEEKVRGNSYERLMNMTTGAVIFIDIYKDQPKSDMNLSVWSEFPGMTTRKLFIGTPVECIRVIEDLAEKFDAKEIDPWR